ncbi:mitochondrial 54S ribosomal protein YmL49 [Martiniozyma asiatica (nom. inval.)]|nr:mitochondrial 54S ribosomal protein YmL49 [Martiniozyma asiatica]
MLRALKNELSLYAQLRIHNSNYTVTKGDLIKLPFALKSHIGDKIRFDNVVQIGSRNYTWHDKNGIDTSKILVEAVVVEKSREPLIIKEVTKKRDRHVKHITTKPSVTVLRVNEVKLLD